MNKAHLFFPENDLALARNLDNYTAPGPAMKLRMSGYTLPMWFMDEDDCFIAQGVNAAWLNDKRERFDIRAKVYDRRPEAWMPCPWGWSRAARRFFNQMGFEANQLPDDATLDRIRELSHRRTASEIARRLDLPGTPVAEELSSFEAVKAYAEVHGEVVIKLPWSSTGRGILMTDSGTIDQQRGQIEGMIANQGSVMAEPRLKGLMDLAMLFTMQGGHATYEGLSVFHNSSTGRYEANILDSQANLERMCMDYIGGDAMNHLREALPPILESIIGVAYNGPLGIDMMIYDDGGKPTLDAAIELNLRNTMGHVALRFYERHCAAEAKGRFAVLTERPEENPQMDGNRMAAGTMCLNPTGGQFSFAVTLE